MNVARSDGTGYWWHVADGPHGVYIRLGGSDGIVLPREKAESLLEGLKEVLGD